MIRISTLALIAIAAAGIASPVFAQSSPHRVGMHKVHRHAVVARETGLNAFAVVPWAGDSAFSPVANGGGSTGYNEHIRRDQW